MIEELVARTADGVALRIDHVRAHGPRRGVVVCLHAMMTDGRYFGARREGSFARSLADAGLDVLVADFRGHGRSTPPHAGKHDWSFDDLVELDVPAIITAAAHATGVAPRELAILGHSLGGLAASAAIATARIPPPRVLALAAATVWRGETLARRALMSAIRGITRAVGRAPIRALRVGSADEAALYVDQLTGWTFTRRWTSLRGIDYRAALATLDTPTFAFTGARDWMCPPRDAESFARQIPTCEPVRVIGRAHGDAVDPDHFELFTRRELAPLWHELANQLTAAST